MLRIILADDHAEVRKGIVQLLSEEFAPVLIEEAEGGLELVNKVLSGTWDIVVTDLAMPGCTGLEALKEIRKANNPVPVIIISSAPADQYRTRVMQAGAEAFISKNSLTVELLETIQSIIDRKPG